MTLRHRAKIQFLYCFVIENGVKSTSPMAFCRATGILSFCYGNIVILLREYYHFATGILSFCYGNIVIISEHNIELEMAQECGFTRFKKKWLDTVGKSRYRVERKTAFSTIRRLRKVSKKKRKKQMRMNLVCFYYEKRKIRVKV